MDCSRMELLQPRIGRDGPLNSSATRKTNDLLVVNRTKSRGENDDTTTVSESGAGLPFAGRMGRQSSDPDMRRRCSSSRPGRGAASACPTTGAGRSDRHRLAHSAPGLRGEQPDYHGRRGADRQHDVGRHREGHEPAAAVRAGRVAVRDRRRAIDGDQHSGRFDVEPPRSRRESQPRAARRASRDARERIGCRGHQHDPGRRDLTDRDDHRRRVLRLRRGRDGGRRELHLEEELRGHRLRHALRHDDGRRRKRATRRRTIRCERLGREGQRDARLRVRLSSQGAASRSQLLPQRLVRSDDGRVVFRHRGAVLSGAGWQPPEPDRR